jgi:hypothetical protein
MSRALRHEIVSLAAARLGLDPTDDNRVLDALDRIGERLLRSDSRGHQAFRRGVESLAAELDDEVREEVADVVVRFMRTPSFLVRFVDL